MQCKSFLFPKSLRQKYIGSSALFLSLFLIILVALFVCLLADISPVPKTRRDKALWIAILILIEMILSIMPLQLAAYSLDMMRLKYTFEEAVMLSYGMHRNKVVIDASVFVCKIPISFKLKTDDPTLLFYMLSNNPISQDWNQMNGVTLVFNLIQSGVVLLPVDEEIDQWFINTLSITQVPTFPKVGYRQAIKSKERE